MCVYYHLSLCTLSVDDGRERQDYLPVWHSCLNSQRFVCAGSEGSCSAENSPNTKTNSNRELLMFPDNDGKKNETSGIRMAEFKFQTYFQHALPGSHPAII